jgi:hypothetical protein
MIPHTPLWDNSIEEHLHMSIITKWKARFKHDISEMLILNLPFSTLMTSKLDAILSWAILDHTLDACSWQDTQPT